MDALKVIAAGPVRRTHIMYRSNTSWIILRANLDDLTASGFIRETGQEPRLEYSITDRGMHVLRDYIELVERASRQPTDIVR